MLRVQALHRERASANPGSQAALLATEKASVKNSQLLITLTLSPARVLRCLSMIIVLLTSASVAAHLYTEAFRKRSFFALFDLEVEGNLSTWFASTSLLAAAALLFSIRHNAPLHFARRWSLLAALFLFVAVDEAAQFHEFTILPLRTALNLGGLFYFSWVVLAIPAVVCLAMVYLPFLRMLSSRVRRLALVAAVLYLSGALGMEMINGAYAELHGYKTLTYKLMTDLEESLEMAGVALWIFALLVHIESHAESGHSERTYPAATAGSG